jgi:hypothetical protein
LFDIGWCRNGEEYLTATVNIMGSNLAPDEVLIKDYSENEENI